MSYGIDKNTWEEIKAQIKIEIEYNRCLIDSAGISIEDFEDLLWDCTVTGKIEITDSPCGSKPDEVYSTIKSVYVDQRSVGMEGDCFVGFIYAEFDNNKWLKIPYEC